MTDAERVEQIYHKSSPDMLTPEGWQFLIKMARIGASVMPRPIDDDAKNGEPMLCWCDMEGVKFVQVLTYDRVTPIHPWYDQEGVGYHAEVPQFYAPAKELPKPAEVTT